MAILALFTFVPDLLDHLRATYSPNSPVQYDQLFEQVKSTPLLILDDLGAETSTPWAKEKLYQTCRSPSQHPAAHDDNHLSENRRN